MLEDSLHFHATLTKLNGISHKADCIVLFLSPYSRRKNSA